MSGGTKKVAVVKFEKSWAEEAVYANSFALRDLAIPVYNAFAAAFPSLPHLEWGEGCMSTGFSPATILYGLQSSPYHSFRRMKAFLDLIEECSCEGEWPAAFAYDFGLFEAIPYTGDRRLTVHWTVSGVTVTCDYSRRPSLVAAKRVIALAAELGGEIEYAPVVVEDFTG